MILQLPKVRRVWRAAVLIVECVEDGNMFTSVSRFHITNRMNTLQIQAAGTSAFGAMEISMGSLTIRLLRIAISKRFGDCMDSSNAELIGPLLAFLIHQKGGSRRGKLVSASTFCQI